MTIDSFPEWQVTPGLTPYPDALADMEARAAAIRAGTAPERIWLLEHPPLYTAGTSAKPQDLLQPMRFPVHVAGRGGQYTYHGPGQRVAYVMLDLKGRRPDVRAYVASLMGRVTEPGKFANWIAPPPRGINNLPIDFSYVRFN